MRFSLYLFIYTPYAPKIPHLRLILSSKTSAYLVRLYLKRLEYENPALDWVTTQQIILRYSLFAVGPDPVVHVRVMRELQ